MGKIGNNRWAQVQKAVNAVKALDGANSLNVVYGGIEGRGVSFVLTCDGNPAFSAMVAAGGETLPVHHPKHPHILHLAVIPFDMWYHIVRQVCRQPGVRRTKTPLNPPICIAAKPPSQG